MDASLTVIGGASLDTLHFQARTVRSAGGAGLYTALAAQRAGARVTMLGPRPKPMPTELAEAARRLDWRGATVPPEQLPSFEIAHMGDGRSEMRAAHWRAEAELSVDDLPPDLPPGMVYCIPLTDPERQLEFIRHVKALGHPVACGTYAGAAADHPDVVHRALAATDAFFCNESEAISLFGDLGAARTRPGKLLFVTRSARGVRILQGDHATDLPAETAAELDPTGAGDTFCGTTLAHLASGAHPLQAARQAIVAAAEMVTDIGPAALLRPPKGSKSGSVSVDSMQVRRVAGRLAELPEIAPFPFTGDDFPPVGHPAALDYFFAATLQQFGFWTAAGDRYQEPWVAQFGGRRLKGSDYLWAAYCHWLDEDPTGLAPVGQSRLDAETLERRLASDDGSRLPALPQRLQQCRAYGRDCVTLDLSPSRIVERANADSLPLQRFLTQLDQVGGYKEDPLRKKSILLALILQQRPEGFLRCNSAEPVPAIVDYHIQRSCLRTGLVRVDDEALRRRLIARQKLDPESEFLVRQASAHAVEAVQRASGRSMGAVDWFFFQNRRRCPEMTEPECHRCPVEPVCAQDTALFQPVRRTTFY